MTAIVKLMTWYRLGENTCLVLTGKSYLQLILNLRMSFVVRQTILLYTNNIKENTDN